MGALYLPSAGIFRPCFWLIYIWGACPHSLFSPSGSFLCQIFPRIPLWANPVVLGNVPSVYSYLAIGRGFSVFCPVEFFVSFCGFCNAHTFHTPTVHPQSTFACCGAGVLCFSTVLYFCNRLDFVCVCVCVRARARVCAYRDAKKHRTEHCQVMCETKQSLARLQYKNAREI